MKQNISHLFAHKKTSLFLWSLAGFLIAASIRCADMFPELFQRLHVASTGGGGESAVWDETLFYMGILGFPAGLLGALIALAVAVAVYSRSPFGEKPIGNPRGFRE